MRSCNVCARRPCASLSSFFNDTATTEIYTLSLHDALPISQGSPSDHPVVQLRSIESERTLFLLCTNWSTNSFTAAPVWGFPPGYALVTVFVNGVPSTGSVLSISVPVPSTPTLTAAKRLGNGSLQFAFTNSPGALFGVLATTNLALPLSDWTLLSGVTETSPGQFQFTDGQAATSPKRFYRVHSQ